MTADMTPRPIRENRYDQADIVATIKQTVAKGATDAQLRMFLEVCKATGLDPFLKEIWYVAEKGLIMAARDGYLRVANENPMFDGIETRVERDAKGIPVKAVCTVWRKDRGHPTICEAYYNEYNKNSPVWKQYPSAMISKVAEVLALKRSFAINGVVSEEEVANDPRGPHEMAPELQRGKPESALALPAPEPPRPSSASTKAVPLELEPMFKRLDKDPRAFPTAVKLLEEALVDKAGPEDGLRIYDEIADAFYEKFPQGTTNLNEMKAVLTRLHEAIATAPVKAQA